MKVDHVELANLPNWIKGVIEGVAPALRRATIATANRGKAVVVGNIDRAKPTKPSSPHQGPPVDRGVYRNSWQVEEEKDGAVLFSDAPHAAFIERGTRPHTPPLAPLIAWVKRKKLGKGEDAVGIAKAIQRAIQRRGTPPYKILEKSIPEIRKILDEEIELALKEAVG